MRFPHTLLALVIVALLGISPRSYAATKCVIGDTVEKCWQKYLPDSPPRAKTVTTGDNPKDAKEAEESIENLLKNFETGLGGGTSELATTTHNLLPLLAMSGLVSDADGNANNQLFAIDLNFLLGSAAKDHNTQLRAVLNTDPQLFKPLKTSIDTATGSADQSAELQKSLTASDDYTIAFTYSHINKRFGRSFKQYQLRYSNLFEAAITAGSGPPMTADQSIVAMAGVLQRLNAGTTDALDNDTVLRDARALEAVETAARDEAKLEQRVHQAMAFNKLSRFAELVNNQPQLTFSADLHERDPLVGAREEAIRVSYEFGLANVSKFEDSSNGVCSVLDREVRELSLQDAGVCLDRFREYIDANEQRLQNADRFSFEASYVKISDYDYSSPQSNVAVSRDGSHRVDLAVGYGRTMQVAGDGRDSRLDIVAKYENYSDDPDHQDRLVATATLTTKLGGISIPFTLVYANHGRFLPDVDKQLTVHVGLKYQFDPK